MTLDEAIVKARRASEELIRNTNLRLTDYDKNLCRENAEINRQLAEWLEELKQFRESQHKTNFEICCESVENMAQVIDIAKCGWTKDEIIAWLNREAKGE